MWPTRRRRIGRAWRSCGRSEAVVAPGEAPALTPPLTLVRRPIDLARFELGVGHELVFVVRLGLASLEVADAFGLGRLVVRLVGPRMRRVSALVSRGPFRRFLAGHGCASCRWEWQATCPKAVQPSASSKSSGRSIVKGDGIPSGCHTRRVA